MDEVGFRSDLAFHIDLNERNRYATDEIGFSSDLSAIFDLLTCTYGQQ